jgi:ribosomal-protein-alanine N-acetyltransferase
VSSEKFIIRPYNVSDREQLQALVRPLVGVAFNWSKENLDKELHEAQTWVLVESDQVLAFVCLRDLTQAWDLTMVATKLERQRSGVMEKLMSFIIGKYAVDRPLWLEVHQNNRGAQKFYKKMGFQHTGNRGGYYSDGSAALLFTFQNPLLY